MTKRSNPSSGEDYRSWKQKQEKKEMNVASFTEFPDLVKQTQVKSVLSGVSLASKLKETIAAEEEAAIIKRLKKGETPESILEESCVRLPCKSGKQYPAEITVPLCLLDTADPIVFPSFKHKSLDQLAEERRWKRLGIKPTPMKLVEPEEEEDHVSLPSDDGEEEEEQTQVEDE